MAEEKINELKKRVEVQRKVLGSLAKSLEGEDILKRFKGTSGEAVRGTTLFSRWWADERFVLSWPETRRCFSVFGV